jgi:2-polyprenyl-3-methyl-5-hydroxy-6-metoxy-1,4-benzoquinol methylase
MRAGVSDFTSAHRGGRGACSETGVIHMTESDNLVRDLHDAVAGSDSLAEASVRPAGTSGRELRALRHDALRKLRLAPGLSVVEIGCGIGLLGVPVARRARCYVGLDFAPHAVAVANSRLRAASLAPRARAICVDVLKVDSEELKTLGCFDRVLVYSVLHYARTEAEALRFLQSTVELLAPRGRALVGNMPLEDLRVDWPARKTPGGLPVRMLAATRWAAKRGTAPVPLTRRWKLRRLLEMALKARSSAERFAPAQLPSGYTIALTSATVERLLATLGEELAHHWELPAPGVPLASARADLIISRP